jgi:hypothetical protein
LSFNPGSMNTILPRSTTAKALKLVMPRTT